MPSSFVFPTDKFHFKSDSVFDGLSKNDLEFIQAHMMPQKYRKGKSIFIEGSVPMGIYYVVEGKVKKYKVDRDGREQIIYICNSGELFGYPALLSEESFPDSASTLEDSVIGFISKKDFLHLLHQSALLSQKLLKNLSHEFGVLENSIVALAHKSVRERLALSLLILREKYKDPEHPLRPAEITLSREDLSNIVGTAIETLVRLLHDFKDDGLVETEGRKIRVMNPKKLAKIANFY